MEEQKDEGQEYTLTKNVLTKGKHFGVNDRNWAEAFVFSIIVATIILAIPFTEIVTKVSLFVLLPIVFGLNLKGIKHRSLTEMLKAEIKFRQNRRRLHFRGPQYVRKNYKTTYTESEDESYAEQHYRIIKQRFNEFLEKYGSEEDS